MSHELQLVFALALAFASALCGGIIAHRLRQSPIIGYLLAGMVMGPFAREVVGSREQIAVLAEIGVIFLMFALGIEFSLKELARIKGAAIVGTVLQVLLLMAAGTGLGLMLHWSLAQAVFFGGVISVSSTMVILKNLMDRGEVESNHGRLLLAMLIVQDLVVVVLLLLLPRLTSGGAVDFFNIALLLAKGAVFILATLFLGMRVVPKAMAHVEELRSSELFLLTAVVLALGTASLSAWLGLSPALGAFMGGLLLTETDFERRVVLELVPLRDIFSTLFFVSVGLMIDIPFILANPMHVVGMAIFIVLAKVICTMLALSPFRVGGKTTAFAALGMVPIGEFNYVLAHAGYRAGAIGERIYDLVLTSSLLTILVTPGAFWIAPRLDRVLSRLPLWNSLMTPRFQEPEIAAPRAGHAIIVGYGRVGRRMAHGLKRAGLPITIIEQDLNIVRELKEKGEHVIYGDASYESVLAMAHPQGARLFVVALPDFGATRAVVHRARRASPETLIIARAQRAEDDVKLREAGATAVVVPEIAGALMLLEETLILLGLPHEHIFTGVRPVTDA